MLGASLLSNFPIRTRILIGFVPVFLLLIYLASSSYRSLNVFSQNFDHLLNTASEREVFLAIEKDIVELQRNVLVYSYAGYRGVLRKIEFLQGELEEKFEVVRPIAQQDAEINDRFQRMFGHYTDYKVAFSDAVLKKAEIEDLNLNKIAPLVEEKYKILDQIIDDLGRSRNYEITYLISQIERDLILADAKINTFERSPDTALIREANQLIDQIQESTLSILEKNVEETTRSHLADFVDLLEQYQTVIEEISIHNSVYLHLVNVVLAGKAAEIDVLSKELDQLTAALSQSLSNDININVAQEKNQYVFFALLALALGTISSLIIAKGIAKPVNEMAATLTRLSSGEYEVEVPGLHRKDEVGKMARSADAFKALAAKVEMHREALRYSNLELEDLTKASIESKQFLELTMNNVPDMLFVKDSQYRIVEANAAFLSAYPEDVRGSVIGTTTLEKYDPAEAEQFLYFDKKAMEEGYSETEETVLFPDGQRRVLFTKKVRFKNPSGQQFILGIARDITEIKKAESELQESQERYETAVKGSSSGLWDWNIKTQQLFWSPLLKKLLGVEDESEYLSDPRIFENRIHPEDKQKTLRSMVSHLKHREPFDIECRATLANGGIMWLHVRGHAIWDSDGNALRMAGSATDVTVRKAAEELLVEANAELEEFAYRTSHDLRSPIISSIALLEYSNAELEQGNVSDGMDAISHAHSSLQKLNGLIEEIFQLTVIRNRKESIRTVNVQTIINDCLSKLSNLDNFDRLNINVDLGATQLETKKIAFTTIIENLLSNAVKYQDPSREKSYLDIKTSFDDHEFVLDISDNGLGIPLNQRQHLFAMFKRFHPKVSFGSGLGLYLVKKCADTISANVRLMEQTEGTAFQVRIPNAKAEQQRGTEKSLT